MQILDRLLQDRPAFHLGGAARWDSTIGTLKCIQDRVRASDRTLEIGCGASTVIFAASGSRHTVVSPDVREHQLVIAYCDKAGISTKNVTFQAGLSDNILPTLGADRIFDAAFIDGAHAFPYPLVDWHYTTRLLKIGGWLLLDDVPIVAVSYLYRFMQSDPAWRFDAVFDDRTAAFTLFAEPEPEDWSRQAFSRRMDYSFVPLTRRLALRTRDNVKMLRQAAGRRYPFLRKVWRGE